MLPQTAMVVLPAKRHYLDARVARPALEAEGFRVESEVLAYRVVGSPDRLRIGQFAIDDVFAQNRPAKHTPQMTVFSREKGRQMQMPNLF